MFGDSLPVGFWTCMDLWSFRCLLFVVWFGVCFCGGCVSVWGVLLFVANLLLGWLIVLIFEFLFCLFLYVVCLGLLLVSCVVVFVYVGLFVV